MDLFKLLSFFQFHAQLGPRSLLYPGSQKASLLLIGRKGTIKWKYPKRPNTFSNFANKESFSSSVDFIVFDSQLLLPLTMLTRPMKKRNQVIRNEPNPKLRQPTYRVSTMWTFPMNVMAMEQGRKKKITSWIFWKCYPLYFTK